MNTKKKRGRPGAQEPAEHAVRLYLPAQAHRELRVEAARRGVPMSDYAQSIVLDALGFAGRINRRRAKPGRSPDKANAATTTEPVMGRGGPGEP